MIRTAGVCATNQTRRASGVRIAIGVRGAAAVPGDTAANARIRAIRVLSAEQTRMLRVDRRTSDSAVVVAPDDDFRSLDTVGIRHYRVFTPRTTRSKRGEKDFSRLTPVDARKALVRINRSGRLAGLELEEGASCNRTRKVLALPTPAKVVSDAPEAGLRTINIVDRKRTSRRSRNNKRAGSCKCVDEVSS